jgi:hypothetical protein
MGRAFQLPGDPRRPTLWNFRAAYGSLARCGIVVRLADIQMRRIRDGMKLTRWDMTDKWMVSGWDWMVVDFGRLIMLGQFMSPRGEGPTSAF